MKNIYTYLPPIGEKAVNFFLSFLWYKTNSLLTKIRHLKIMICFFCVVGQVGLNVNDLLEVRAQIVH